MDKKLYVSITTIRHYKCALDLLLSSIPKELENRYIIIYQKEDCDDYKVFEDGHIEVTLRQNLHDYAHYVGLEMLLRNNVISNDTWFLMIHDTCKFGPNSYNLIMDYVREFDKSHVDVLWICKLGRCNISLTRNRTNVINYGYNIYKDIMELPKSLAYEWDFKDSRCPKSFPCTFYFLPEESQILGNRYVYNDINERVVLYYKAIDLEKYFCPFKDESEHPKAP